MLNFFVCSQCGYKHIDFTLVCCNCDPNFVRTKYQISTTHACEGGEI